MGLKNSVVRIAMGRRTLLGKTRKAAVLALFLAFTVLLAFGQSQSQDQSQSQSQSQNPQLTLTSDLAQENFSRVAASAAQISAVLHKDAGIMVQLKLWVAKDATDHGQIVSDSDLTDQAIYDRLQTDVMFRSVATALLQKFGYLLPQFNPDSSMGKEEDLYVQERAKWLASNAGQNAAVNQPNGNQQLTNYCLSNPNAIPGCQTSQMPGQNQGYYPGGLPSGVPSNTYPTSPTNPSPFFQAPTNPLQITQNPAAGMMQTGFNPSMNSFSSLSQNPLMQATPQFNFHSNLLGQNGMQTGGGSNFGLLSGAGNDSGDSLRDQASQLLGGGQLSSMFSGGGGGMSSLAASAMGGSLMLPSDIEAMSPDEQMASAMANSTGPLQAINPRTGLPEYGFNGMLPSATGWNGPYPSGVNPYQGYYLPNGELVNAGTMFHRPNPYWEIPSLYDMYQQTLARPPAPERFGIDVFENGAQDPQLIPMDLPAGPDYVVGPGDGLNVDLWGGVSERLFRVVDREGRISLPEVGPVPVSGKTLANVQQTVQRILQTQYRDVSADVSLSLLKTVRVYVVGNVLHPGAYDISSLSTPLNALFAAGGPTDQGSMRFVQHDRGKELVQDVDVYDLLLHGVRTDIMPLQNGDTVLVPPIGPQVTVDGMVRRPAIYELRNEKSLADVLALAGGLLPTATLRHIEVQRTIAHQGRTMLSLDIPETANSEEVTNKLESFQVQDGDKIRVFPIAPYNEDAVYLEGHVIRPGRYSFHKDMKLTDLIGSYKDLLPEPSTQYADIIRLNPPDDHPSVVSFNLAKALEDPENSPTLHPMDTVEIFGRFDFQDVPTVSVLGDVRDAGTYQTPGQIHLSDAIHLAGGLAPDASRENAQVFRYLPDGKLKIFSVSLNQALDGNPLDDIMLQPRDRVLIHKNLSESEPASVEIKGQVARPGRYPLTSGMSVSDLIHAAGGMKLSADTTSADLMRYQWEGQSHITGQHEDVELASAMNGNSTSNTILHNGDVLTIRQLPGWDDLGATIAVRGEVKNPGEYGIRPGERLSSILSRAGGFSPDAYPYGAVLERKSVQEMEQKTQDELIGRLQGVQAELKLTVPADLEHKEVQAEALEQYQTTLESLTNNPPVGRLTIQISSDIKGWKDTSRDVTVHSGDILIIPKKPSYVMVQGQVYNPTAVSFRPGKSAKWYLEQAGGPTNLANRKAIFVIRADGTVIGSRGSSMWSGGTLSQSLQPGDTVMAPEKSLISAGPIDWKTILQMGQILSAATASAVLAARY